ncbi:MAG: redox-sensing transcriptional repressor Rex [Pseudomonadota bacterium]
MKINVKTVQRFSLYRRLLLDFQAEEARERIYSYELAALAGNTAAQVRRDFMALGSSGCTAKGYEIGRLVESIATVLDSEAGQKVAIVGTGHLGKAVIDFFRERRPKLTIVAAFDVKSDRVDRSIHGCPVHHVDRLEEVVRREGVTLGILTVPAGVAQETAEALVRGGVRGIANFAPTRLRLPPDVHVEDLDMTTSLETVAYFARVQGEAADDADDLLF